MPKTTNNSCCCCLNNIWDIKSYKLLDICKVCGMGRAKDMPSEAELSKFYQQNYFFGDEYVDYIKDRGALEKNFKKRVQTLLDFSKKKKNLKVCEIGSAYGFFLNLMKPYASKTLGFEMGEDGVNFANENFNVNTSNKDFLTTKVSNDQDICVMWDVIEHLRYPDKYIEKMAKVLKKGGLISLTTGDIDTFVARRKKDDWRMIHPPTHLYYFTKKSLEILLERNGLSPVQSSYPTHYRNVGSVLGMLRLDSERKGKPSGFFKVTESIIQKTPLHRINFGLNTKDIVFITARKTSDSN